MPPQYTVGHVSVYLSGSTVYMYVVHVQPLTKIGTAASSHFHTFNRQNQDKLGWHTRFHTGFFHWWEESNGGEVATRSGGSGWVCDCTLHRRRDSVSPLVQSTEAKLLGWAQDGTETVFYVFILSIAISNSSSNYNCTLLVKFGMFVPMCHAQNVIMRIDHFSWAGAGKGESQCTPPPCMKPCIHYSLQTYDAVLTACYESVAGGLLKDWVIP